MCIRRSQIVLNRTLAWEVLCASCLMEMSRLVEVTHLMDLKIPHLVKMPHIEKILIKQVT